jgi:hypothetical protein
VIDVAIGFMLPYKHSLLILQVMGKSRKRQLRGQWAVMKRATNPPVECGVCFQVVHSTARRPNQLGRLLPCGCKFHYDCMRRLAVTLQAVEGRVLERCARCQRGPVCSLERLDDRGAEVLSTESLPLRLHPAQLTAARRAGSMWDDDIDISPRMEEQGESEREAAAAERGRRARYSQHIVAQQEIDFRSSVLRTLTAAGLVDEVGVPARVLQLGAILHHVRRNRPGDSALTAPGISTTALRAIDRQLTAKRYHVEGIEGLEEAGYKAVAYFCGSPDVPSHVRAEAVSYVRCRLVMVGAATQNCAGKLLKPPGWENWVARQG